jgi:hypothetical protein
VSFPVGGVLSVGGGAGARVLIRVAASGWLYSLCLD